MCFFSFSFLFLGFSQDYHYWTPAPPTSIWLPAHHYCKWWIPMFLFLFYWNSSKYLKPHAMMEFSQMVKKISIYKFFNILLQFPPTWRACPWLLQINYSTCWRLFPPPGFCSLLLRTITLSFSFWRLSTILFSISLMVSWIHSEVMWSLFSFCLFLKVFFLSHCQETVIWSMPSSANAMYSISWPTCPLTLLQSKRLCKGKRSHQMWFHAQALKRLCPWRALTLQCQQSRVHWRQA